jgi:chromosome segregation ATPase
MSHIFAKSLSKHSIGIYMELYREVGVSFEAVRPDFQPAVSSAAPTETLPYAEDIMDVEYEIQTPCATSFTERIEILQEENQRIRNEVDRLNQDLLKEVRLKSDAEQKIAHFEQLELQWQEKMSFLNDNVQSLEKENKKLRHGRDSWKKRANRAMGILERLQFDLRCYSSEQQLEESFTGSEDD